MKQILIIDDEVNLSELIRRILEREGFHTLMAHNGLEGLKLLEQLHVDLVLMDVMMPGINGIEVCYQIKNNPSSAAIPVVFMTASRTLDTQQKFLEAGADQILYKPFDTDELLQIIDNLLNAPLLPPPVISQQSQCT